MLPALRADMAAYDAYRHVPGPPLPCAITAWAGRDDRNIRQEALDQLPDTPENRALLRQKVAGLRGRRRPI